MIIKTDIVIIGSGVASLQAAKVLSQHFDVHIVTKADITNGSSYKAQGGIAAVTNKEDHTSFHIHDTLVAGEHHHDTENVKMLVEQGKTAMNELIDDHFKVDKNQNGDLSLGLEGAHSKPRIVHAGGDATGKFLIDFLRKELPENVHIHEYEMAYELLLNTDGECVGVKTMNGAMKKTYFSSYVILATGGAGAIYACTSNCENSFGDGIALAFLAGAKITDMEFFQFHPSLLYVDGAARGLVSEAVRGEGGRFIDKDGKNLMGGIHPLGDLAPRHITAYEMYKQRAKDQDVFIDISMIDNFETKFPTITSLCEEHGVNISEGRLPIAPGSHFLMGGVVADPYGNTSIPRLLAVGEVACTGVHGANRLASNSLLEGITFGKLMAENLVVNGSNQTNFQLSYKENQDRLLQLLPKEQLQKDMLKYAGILRDAEGLQHLVTKLPSPEELRLAELSSFNQETIELLFMHITATLVATAALERKESRGAHIRKDYEYQSNRWQHQWIVFEHGKTNVRSALYEHNQTESFA